jgi:hypothetical protein
MHVELSKDFHYGKNEGEPGNVFVDYPAMTKTEKLILVKWIHNILEENDHEGSNKESWLIIKYGNTRLAPTADTYRTNQLWHYHFGNDYTSNGGVMTLWDLPSNDDGGKSAAVIHYKKMAGNVLVIAFAREHLPFPKISDHGNKLRSRLHKIE